MQTNTSCTIPSTLKCGLCVLKDATIKRVVVTDEDAAKLFDQIKDKLWLSVEFVETTRDGNYTPRQRQEIYTAYKVLTLDESNTDLSPEAVAKLKRMGDWLTQIHIIKTV